MVVREFTERCIAPLQRHGRRVWFYAGPQDPMRLSVPHLGLSTMESVWRALLADSRPLVLPVGVTPLFDLAAEADRKSVV